MPSVQSIEIKQTLRLANRAEETKMNKTEVLNQKYMPSLAQLQKLAEDDDPLVRVIAANHFYSPAELLLSLQSYDDERVRQALAANPYCPLECLEKLSKDSSDSVRLSMAKNPNLNKTLFPLLMQDSNETVAYEAHKTYCCSILTKIDD